MHDWGNLLDLISHGGTAAFLAIVLWLLLSGRLVGRGYHERIAREMDEARDSFFLPKMGGQYGASPIGKVGDTPPRPTPKPEPPYAPGYGPGRIPPAPGPDSSSPEWPDLEHQPTDQLPATTIAFGEPWPADFLPVPIEDIHTDPPRTFVGRLPAAHGGTGTIDWSRVATGEIRSGIQSPESGPIPGRPGDRCDR